jgi:hypothetical protein
MTDGRVHIGYSVPTSKQNICNFKNIGAKLKKYTKKLLGLFDCGKENSHRNMSTIFHTTFTVK